MEPTPDLPELLYLFDPLCGWCYGMTPVIQRARREFAGRVTTTALCGGMITGDRVEPIGANWGYISGASQQVAQVTGADFGVAFRQVGEDGTQVQNSEPPSRAVAVFRQLDPQNRAVDFAHDVQTAFFRDGHDLSDPATYPPLLLPYGLDAAEFARLYAAPATAQAVQREFSMVARLGVQGFPTTVLRVGGEGYVLARGYQPYPAFADGLTQALAL